MAVAVVSPAEAVAVAVVSPAAAVIRVAVAVAAVVSPAVAEAVAPVAVEAEEAPADKTTKKCANSLTHFFICYRENYIIPPIPPAGIAGAGCSSG